MIFKKLKRMGITTNRLWALGLPLAIAGTASAFDGEWRTSFGVVTLEQTGADVTGVYGNEKQFTLKGTVDGDKLTFEYQEGQATGDGHWTLDKSGHAFGGEFQLRGGRGGAWKGWRPDPEAAGGAPADFGDLWLTDLGLMELRQEGDQVKGRYALGGVTEIEGTATGRRLKFRTKGFRSGEGWFDLSAKGDSLAGAARTDGFPGWYGWGGRRAPEFVRHAKLIPGKIVNGSTKGLLTYSVRAPEGYRHKGGKRWPAIVILHGSNMNGKAYVNTLAAAWPDIGKRYMIIGLHGERPSSTGDDPRFNYTYVNFVGRSTFKGFPGTDRESPALVAEALDELREAYPLSRYFVGGHSQGGFLTYSLLMNYPEKIAGAFPISAGVIFQCEPSAYEDEALRAAQRAVPLAIIHGKSDPAVAFSSGEYAAVLFSEAGWPAFRFFADDTGAGHMFGRLPVGEAIDWLESLRTNDPSRLGDFAAARMKAPGGMRDAVIALNRARALKPAAVDADAKARLDRLASQINAKAAAGAEKFLPKVAGGEGGPWVDDFLAYRDDYAFTPAAREVMKAFAELRENHEAPAKQALSDARAAFQQGDRDRGYAKYQEIVDEHYASSAYRNAKRWLAERK